MSNPLKRKGDAAELEAARIIHDLLGFPARRKLGAGRLDDTGDIDGCPTLWCRWPTGATSALQQSRSPTVPKPNASTQAPPMPPPLSVSVGASGVSCSPLSSGPPLCGRRSGESWLRRTEALSWTPSTRFLQ